MLSLWTEFYTTSGWLLFAAWGGYVGWSKNWSHLPFFILVFFLQHLEL